MTRECLHCNVVEVFLVALDADRLSARPIRVELGCMISTNDEGIAECVGQVLGQRGRLVYILTGKPSETLY